MVELKDLLSMEQRKKSIKLSKTEKTVIDYLLDLRGKRLSIEKMAKETGIGKPTIYDKLERLQKVRIISSRWKLNSFVLGFQIIETEAKISKSKEQSVLKSLVKHPAVLNIRRTFQGNLLIEIVVRDMRDFTEIKNYFEKLGVNFMDQRIIVGKIYES